MRKFIAIFTAAAMMTAAFTACSSSDVGQEPDNSSSSTTTSAPAENEGDSGNDSSEDNGNEVTEGGNEDNSGSDSDISTAAIVDAVKGAYDPDSIPFIDLLPEELIGDMYGLDADTYTEVTAHVPMISTFVDTVVVVKAAEGKVSDVEAALKAHHTRLVEDSIQYPMNIAKVNAGQVVVNGDYVAFIMLGAIDERDDASESERAEFAEEQTKIGVDAFNACFA